MSKHPRVAILYDWLTTSAGGAEQVIQALAEIWPDATFFSLVHDLSKTPWSKEWKIKTSGLNQVPLFKKYHRLVLPFVPLAVESLDLTGFDLIISITSLGMKGCLTKPNQLHVCYLLTPPRFLLPNTPQPAPFWLKPIIKYYAWWDQTSSFRPDAYLAISKVVSTRLTAMYGLESQGIVYPPVELPPNHQLKSTQHHWLAVGRLMSYKKFDLAIKAAAINQTPLVIVGTGPEKNKLNRLANQINHLYHRELISLESEVNQAKLNSFYSQAIGLVMPGQEDFGIVGLEALAHGLPVVVNQASGVAELIRNGQEGVHCLGSDEFELAQAMNTASRLHPSRQDLYTYVQQWEKTQFKKNFTNSLAKIASDLGKGNYGF